MTSTLVGFRLGFVESNPVGIGILSKLGWGGLVLEEGGAIAVVVIIWRFYFDRLWARMDYANSVVVGIGLLIFGCASLYFFIQNSLWILLKILGII